MVEVRESQQPGVPLLCLPPEAELAETEDAEPSALQKKRAHSLNRYAVSDGECEEKAGGGGGGEGQAELAGGQGSAVVRGEGVKYATVTHRVSRSHSVRNQDKTVNRNYTQSFALRQKKKGPPPPPPKRSSSAISNSNLTDANAQPQTVTTTGGMLDVPYHQQRRASDLGVSVETGAVETSSVGSVRSIAAMLEMSSIGGGAKGMALQKNFLQVLYKTLKMTANKFAPIKYQVYTLLYLVTKLQRHQPNACCMFTRWGKHAMPSVWTVKW